MSIRGSLLVWLVAAWPALQQASWGQRSANWRFYKVADGLAQSTCVSLSFTPQGRLLARHLGGPSISELDGYTIERIPFSQPGNGRIYGVSGTQLWALAPEGLLEFRDRNWELHPVAEIAAEFQAGRLRVVEPVVSGRLCPVRRGAVLVLLSDRLLLVTVERQERPRVEVLRTAGQSKLERFSGLAPARDGGIWLAGQRGLARARGPLRGLRADTEWREYVLPAGMEIENLQEPRDNADDTITAVAESSRDKQRVVLSLAESKEGSSPDAAGTVPVASAAGQTPALQWTVERVGTERIRHAWHGPDGSRWACTSRSLFQWEAGASQIVENEEISAQQYFDVALEPGGAFWLATSDGLFRYAPLPWRSPGRGGQRDSSLVRCLAGDAEGGLWFVSGSGLHELASDRRSDFPFPPGSALRSLEVRALFVLKDGRLLLVADAGPEREDGGDQAFGFERANGSFRQIEPGGVDPPWKVLGQLHDGSLCLQKCQTASRQECPLLKWDGTRAEPLAQAPPAPELGRTFQSVFSTQNGDLWLSAQHGTAWCQDKQWRMFASTNGSAPEDGRFFTELPDGRIWCAARDKVWEFDGHNWSTIQRGFDQVTGLARARDGSLWVASNSGLHRYVQGAWVECALEEGLPSAGIRRIYEDARGRLWAGTTRGLSLYHPEADPDPPQAAIQNLTGETVPEGGTITLTFSGLDKWKFTTGERVLFSYRLDEREWTMFREANGVSFTDLPAGKHFFQVRAMDRNCNIGPKPARLEFSVVLPWYHEVRLVLISLAGLAGILFFAVLAFNRHRRLLRSYAEVEQKVAERTAQLEIANRELMHSQKMTALGTLAAGIAHDFNNILSIIKGSAQIIEDNLDDGAKVQLRLDRIKTVVEQGSGIVKAMLGFSRDSSIEVGTRCDINTVVEDTIRLLGDRFLREVEVTFEPGPGLDLVQASKDFIQQILLNFIFNAAESMSHHKRIILRTSALARLPANLVLSPATAARYVSVSVHDSGCGISPENLSRVFEPFFTTKALSTRRGTGLGLSMAYELAKKMGAGLSVESAVDQGSTFRLILAVSQPPVAAEGIR